MVSVSIEDVSGNLSERIDRALAGEQVVSSRGGQALVRLVSCFAPPFQRVPDEYAGRLSIPDEFDRTSPDILSDFDDTGASRSGASLGSAS